MRGESLGDDIAAMRYVDVSMISRGSVHVANRDIKHGVKVQSRYNVTDGIVRRWLFQLLNGNRKRRAFRITHSVGAEQFRCALSGGAKSERVSRESSEK